MLQNVKRQPAMFSQSVLLTTVLLSYHVLVYCMSSFYFSARKRQKRLTKEILEDLNPSLFSTSFGDQTISISYKD